MSERVCGVEGCGRRHHAKGLCKMHSKRVGRAANPATARASARARRAANTEKILSQERAWRAANIEKARKYVHDCLARKKVKAEQARIDAQVALARRPGRDEAKEKELLALFASIIDFDDRCVDVMTLPKAKIRPLPRREGCR